MHLSATRAGNPLIMCVKTRCLRTRKDLTSAAPLQDTCIAAWRLGSEQFLRHPSAVNPPKHWDWPYLGMDAQRILVTRVMPSQAVLLCPEALPGVLQRARTARVGKLLP